MKYVFKGWRKALPFQLGEVKTVKELLDAFGKKMPLQIQPWIEQFVGYYNDQMDVNGTFLGCTNKLIAKAKGGMEPFFCTDKPILVLATAADGTFIGMEKYEYAPTSVPELMLARYPRLCAHVICHSLGYATPLLAACLVRDAHLTRPNHCEWIDACYANNARKAVEHAVAGRHSHHGYMAEYVQAKMLVKSVVEKGQRSDMLASWF